VNHRIGLRRIAAAIVCALLAGCADPSVSIKATEFSEQDTATYLILSDQLDRVRNILKKPAKVCAGTFPDGLYKGIAPISAGVLARLASEQAKADIALEVVSSYECLSHFAHAGALFQLEASDALTVAARHEWGACGKWLGGMYAPGKFDHNVDYNLEIKDGVARLTGGRECAANYYWYRT
jgi:hypothetical protein